MDTYRCDGCKKSEADRPRLPMGWKRIGDAVYCRECVKSRYVIRAVTIPISGPIDPADWPRLEEALAAVWRQGTAAWNWCTRQCYLNDRLPSAGAERIDKMPPLPKHLYHDGRAVFPAIPSGSFSAILDQSLKKYMKRRLELLRDNATSLPTYRYPAPFPVRAQDFKVLTLADGRIGVACRIDDRRWTLRLRQGRRYRRPLGAIRKLLAGEADQCEMQLLRQPKAPNTHRRGVDASEPGGGATRTADVMCKIVLRLPIATAGEREGHLLVTTLDDSFLRAGFLDQARPAWWYHADHVVRRCMAHKWRLRRLSEDNKSEVRSRRCELDEHRERLCRKQHDFLKTFRGQAIASLVGFAVRRKVAAVVLDDRERGYLREFDYSGFWMGLSQKLAEHGIELVTRAEYLARESRRRAEEEFQEFRLRLEKRYINLRSNEERDDDDDDDSETGGTDDA